MFLQDTVDKQRNWVKHIVHWLCLSSRDISEELLYCSHIKLGGHPGAPYGKNYIFSCQGSTVGLLERGTIFYFKDVWMSLRLFVICMQHIIICGYLTKQHAFLFSPYFPRHGGWKQWSTSQGKTLFSSGNESNFLQPFVVICKCLDELEVEGLKRERTDDAPCR